MARPIYTHELGDPDFQWLLNSYMESRPEAVAVEMSCLPYVIILVHELNEVSRGTSETEEDPISSLAPKRKDSANRDSDFTE